MPLLFSFGRHRALQGVAAQLQDGEKRSRSSRSWTTLLLCARDQIECSLCMPSFTVN